MQGIVNNWISPCNIFRLLHISRLYFLTRNPPALDAVSMCLNVITKFNSAYLLFKCYFMSVSHPVSVYVGYNALISLKIDI